MIDNSIPTSQFHPYQKPEIDSPARSGSLDSVLEKFGVDRKTFSDLTSPESIDKARTFARNNGAILLGGLAVAVIGAGLLFRRR